MNRAIFLGLLAMNVVWAGSYSATKVLMADAPFFLVTSLRYLIALPPLVAIAAARHGLRMNAGDLLRCAAMGVATFALTPLLMYWGVDLSRASDAAVITAGEPILAAVGAWVFLGERIGRRVRIALVLAFAGVLLLSEFWSESSPIHPAGPLLILVAVMFEASYSVIGKHVLARHPPLKTAAVALGFGCAVNTVAVTALGWWPRATAIPPAGWLLLAGYLAGLCTLVGYTFWFFALRHTPVSKVAISIFVQPVLGVVIAWIWVSEVPTPWQIAGTALICCALAIAVIRPRRAASPEPPLPEDAPPNA